MTISERQMADSRTFSATEFKAKCLDILDRVSRRELDRVVITKRGVTVGVLIPPPTEPAEVETLHGLLHGSVIVPPEIDLTAPIADELFAADQGEIHR
jgi:prevent-host-death family protein